MELCSTLILLSLTSIVIFWIWIKNKHNHWKKLGIKIPPFAMISGHAKDFAKHSTADTVSLHYNFYKSRGLKHGGLYMYSEPWYFAMDLDVVKSIMQNDFQHFTDLPSQPIDGEPLSNHLLNLKGNKWKMMRRKLTPTFTSGKMKMMFETLVDCTHGLKKVMDKEVGSPAVDIKDILGRFTTDIISSCAFGIECNSLENPESEFIQKGKAVFQLKSRYQRWLSLFLLTSVPSLARLLNLKYIPEEITNFYMSIVRKTIDYREKNNVSRKDFMQLLIDLKNKGKFVNDEDLSDGEIAERDNSITVDEISAQAFVFFQAGFETSSTTMTFCLYELASNKDIQEKLREEIKGTLKKHNNLTYDAIMDMPYLDKVINETLRKYPPATLIRRSCTKRYNIPGTDIILEKGEKVFIPVFGIHRDPDYYPNPEKFDPERFSEASKRTRHDFSFLAFGEGPRMCIGRFTTDIISSCAFGIECNSLENPESEFIQKGKAVFQLKSRYQRLLSLFLLTSVPSLARLLNLKYIPEEITNFYMSIVRKTIDYREKNNVSRKDFMQLLIDLKNKGKFVNDEDLSDGEIAERDNSITVDEISAQAFVFFQAGFETSSTTMTFCLYELASNKDIQEKLREEIKGTLKKHNNLTYDAIMDMPYLDKVINETLRKYPPATLIRRSCTKRYNIPGTDIILEKGEKVFIPVFGIHRDPDYYPNPVKFDPERFSEASKRTRHDFSFLAFGEGPRMCIGMRFGLMQAKVGLVTMLGNYEFDVSDKTAKPIKWDPEQILLSALGDIWLTHKKIC